MKPTLEKLEEFEREYLQDAQSDYKQSRYGDYTEIVNKMRSFLNIAAEKKNKVSNELYREHIPASVFGISSDEIADSLGMSENEFMNELTSNLNVTGRLKSKPIRIPKIRIARAILSIVEKKILREKRRVEWLRSKFGCVYSNELREKILRGGEYNGCIY